MGKLGFDLAKIIGFDWDEGNLYKSEIKHKVSKDESEQIFLNRPLWIFDDEVHSKNEKRYGALGKTNIGRGLTIFFTVRKNKVRIISARDQGKKDRMIYHEIEESFKKRSEVKQK